jgi:hypothetical protein
MEIWKVELTYRQRKLTIVDLEQPAHPQSASRVEPVQLGLWDSIKKLDSSALTVRVAKKGQESITLQVDIAFMA